MAGQLYFADNLGVLRQLSSGHVALCATDPPFNSGRDYNIFIPDSDAMKTAFTDIWRWDDAAIATRTDIVRMQSDEHYRQTHDDMSDMHDTQAAYANVLAFLKGWDMMFGKPTSGKMGSMRAYLTFMAPRIVEIRRVLTEIGSFYLHCDPTASHYLKAMCDVVFGVDCFRNEIVWGYGSPGRPKRYFPRKHDILLFYAKGEDNIFNADDILIPHKRVDRRTVQEGWRRGKPKVFDAEAAAELAKGKVPFDWWCDFAPAYKSAKEYLGYPTQKPVKLYERIIKVSSNEGDIVLDPFCGCGTTIDAAAALNRHWIGIDLTVLSLEPIQRRLRERHGLEPFEDYPIKGYPTCLQELKLMLADGRNTRRYKDAEAWAVTRLGMRPTKHIGDGGIDGTMPVETWELVKGEVVRTEGTAVCEFKATKQVNPGMMRDFRTAMRDAEATMGIFIGLVPISPGVKEEMRKEGTVHHNGREIPRIQYWQIAEDGFDSNGRVEPSVELPYIPKPLYSSEAHVDADAQEIML